MDWHARINRNKGALGCCSRAFAQVCELKCSVEDYLEAQFWFFNRSFGRAPRFSEIASVHALDRYRKWAIRMEKGEIGNKTINISVISAYSARKVSVDMVIRYEERVLKTMIHQWGSEETVWELFGAVGDEEVFTDSFKKTRPLWRSMYSDSVSV